MSSNDAVAVLLLFVTMFLGATPLLEKLGLKEAEPLTGILIRRCTITICIARCLSIQRKNSRIDEDFSQELFFIRGKRYHGSACCHVGLLLSAQNGYDI